jgi:hypothetical protein
MSTSLAIESDTRCEFTFVDGRRCKTPRACNEPHYCYFHAQQENERLDGAEAREDLSSRFRSDYVSACSLGASLVRLYDAIARGNLNPKTASNLIYLSQVMLQTIPLAAAEFRTSFGDFRYPDILRETYSRVNPKFVQAIREIEAEEEAEDQAAAAANQPAKR